MSELGNLIVRLQQGIENNRSYIKTIRHPQLLVISLQELHDMIGLNDIKDAIADQVSHLIMLRRRAIDNPKLKEGGMMLNIVIKAGPGCGKSVCATKIAKILYSLGYIDGSKNPKENKPGLLKGMLGQEDTTTTDDSGLLLWILFIFIIILVTFMSLTWSFYEKFGGTWTIAVVVLIILLIIIFAVWASANLSSSSSDQIVNSENVNHKQNVGEEKSEKQAPTPAHNKFPTDDQIVKIVSRQDFVGGYVGWTAKQTLKLLNESLGKVLFVDEAYALLNGPHDEFGMEAITTLNLFLSQHPNEIIVIFAGYKDMLEKGIFTAQPGLKRRFMYHFETQGYTIDELFLIFKSQLEKRGWGLMDDKSTLKVFREYPNAFPAFGGDTERLVNFSELAHSRDYMQNGKEMKIDKLAPIHVRKGIEQLTKNSVKNEEISESDQLNNFMNMMGRQPTKRAVQ